MTTNEMKQMVDEVIAATGWNWAVANAWEKGGKYRVYVNDSRNHGAMGFAELVGGRVTFNGAPGHSMFRNKMTAKINSLPVEPITPVSTAPAKIEATVEENVMEQESNAAGQAENLLKPDSLY